MARLPRPMISPHAIALAVACACTGGSALGDDFRAPTATVSVDYGVTWRNTTLSKAAVSGSPPALRQEQSTTLRGVAPLTFRLKADVFPLSWLGAEADATLDRFTSYAPQNDNSVTPVGHLRADVRAGAALRWVSASGFIVSGSVGFAVSSAPVRQYLLDGAGNLAIAPGAVALTSFGPAFRLGVSAQISRFEGAVNVNALLGVGGYAVSSFEPNLFMGVRLFESESIALALGVDYGALLERSAGNYAGQNHRILLSLRTSFLPAKPVVVVPEAKPGALVVKVRLPDGQPAAGAMVSLDGLSPSATDAQGEWNATPGSGAHQVHVLLGGHRQAKAAANVSAGATTEVVVSLEAVTGPGTVKGVVKAAATGKPLAGVKVGASGKSATTGDDGAYQVEGVGPGAVKVRFEADGFNVGEELVQVPPEAVTTLDVSLEQLGKGSPATVRGLIRSRTGEPLGKATVVVKGLNPVTKVPVNAEGRFVVTIPGGEYLFVISAPGYVSQTKKVTLADGDQAIFHTELQKVTK